MPCGEREALLCSSERLRRGAREPRLISDLLARVCLHARVVRLRLRARALEPVGVRLRVCEVKNKPCLRLTYNGNDDH